MKKTYKYLRVPMNNFRVYLGVELRENLSEQITYEFRNGVWSRVWNWLEVRIGDQLGDQLVDQLEDDIISVAGTGA